MSPLSLQIPLISVIGGASASPEVAARAEALGRALAKARFGLVCGGRGGVMEAVCRGAVRARGSRDECVTVGILPGAERADANPWVDIVLPTGMGFARNALVVMAGQGVIAVDGGAGTLSEMAYAWQFGRPLVALTGCGGWSDRLAGTSLDHRRPEDRILGFADPEEAVAHLAALLGARPS